MARDVITGNPRPQAAGLVGLAAEQRLVEQAPDRVVQRVDSAGLDQQTGLSPIWRAQY